MNEPPIVDLVVGARPNFVKIAPIIRAMQNRGNKAKLRFRIVHTGQHYDRQMSGEFFQELGIPEPQVNLGVGSGSHAEQTARIMVAYEKLLASAPCRLCIVVGDVTSTMACAITAQKQQIRVAHVEGGLRSGDWTMPEEINRLVTDSVTNWFFITSTFANDNLRNAGVGEDRIFFVGNTMIDTLLANLERLRPPPFWNEYCLSPQSYFVLTLHRPTNVDSPEKLKVILDTLESSVGALPVVFPVHPRTARTLEKVVRVPENIRCVEPQAYLEFNYLARYAKAVITDSGGITEETTVMRVPCITLRNSTERPETVAIGTNELAGSDPNRLRRLLKCLMNGRWKAGGVPALWDGQTGERIVTILEDLLLGSADDGNRTSEMEKSTASTPRTGV